jgi:uncharacterized protein (DUF302 family)
MVADEEQQQNCQDSGLNKFRHGRPDPLHQWDIELIENALHAAQAEGSIYIGRDCAQVDRQIAVVKDKLAGRGRPVDYPPAAIRTIIEHIEDQIARGDEVEDRHYEPEQVDAVDVNEMFTRLAEPKEGPFLTPIEDRLDRIIHAARGAGGAGGNSAGPWAPYETRASTICATGTSRFGNSFRRNPMAVDGLKNLASSLGAKETMDRLESLVKSKGLTVFARVDHAAGASAVGMNLRPTELLIFGNARGGTPLMQADQRVGIDLPLKALVHQDDTGKVWLSYIDLHWLAQRFALSPTVSTNVDALSQALEALASAAIKAP